jgi:hypothetical protein
MAHWAGGSESRNGSLPGQNGKVALIERPARAGSLASFGRQKRDLADFACHKINKK